MSTKVYDVLIIGGGPAGLSVATTIVRQLQTAILFDSGVYRNTRTWHMHGVPGFDHVDPTAFRTKAKTDLLRRYDTVEFRKARIVGIQKMDDSGLFRATDGPGNVYEGRKVVLATGVRDVLPDIDGYDECWREGIFHSLFWHGFEEKDGDSAGLLAADMFDTAGRVSQVGNMVLQLAKKLTIYTNGNQDVANNIQANCAHLSKDPDRVTIEQRRIKRFQLISPDASDVLVTLDDGTEIKESFIAHHPAVELNGPFVSQLGLETGLKGDIKVSPPYNETSVHGVFAAGDAASEMKVVTAALYGGTMVGSGLVTQLQAEKSQREQSGE